MKYNKNLDDLKKEYLETPIPEELDFLVKKTLRNSRKHDIKRKNIIKKTSISVASVAVSAVLLTVGINTSPVFASTLSRVPVVSGIIKVLTFREYTVNEDKFNANLKVPSIEGLENEALENSLNEKYLIENKNLYEKFMKEMESLKQNGGGHLGVDSGYTVKTDTDKILSIERYVVNTVGSSSTTMKYDTIDKDKEILITLPSLFKDDTYVNVISKNIKEQMIEQYKADNSKFYWVDGIEQDVPIELFEEIGKDQNFYINADDKLVISFDKYEVAPGYMGVVEFIIPTEMLSDILVSNEYVK